MPTAALVCARDELVRQMMGLVCFVFQYVSTEVVLSGQIDFLFCILEDDLSVCLKPPSAGTLQETLLCFLEASVWSGVAWSCSLSPWFG